MLVLRGRSTAELIADHLREHIVEGTYRPGQQINESLLSTQLQVSRGPVREALQRLCQEGFLVSIRNRGVFVLKLNAADVREIYAVRQAIESAAAATLLSGEDRRLQATCRGLKRAIKDMAEQVSASDWQAISRSDMHFHAALVEGAGNGRLVRTFETLAAETRMCILNLEVAYPRADELVEEHQNILDLLEARDADGVVAAIRRHMLKAVEDLTEGMRQGSLGP